MKRCKGVGEENWEKEKSERGDASKRARQGPPHDPDNDGQEVTGQTTIEDLMVELVGIVFTHVYPVMLPVCRAVCRRWATVLADIHLCSEAAAREGRLEVLRWAHAHGCPSGDRRICAEAAKRGHLAVLQWAHTVGCPWDDIAVKYAEWGGHSHVLQWLRSNSPPYIFADTPSQPPVLSIGPAATSTSPSVEWRWIFHER